MLARGTIVIQRMRLGGSSMEHGNGVEVLKDVEEGNGRRFDMVQMERSKSGPEHLTIVRRKLFSLWLPDSH
jgi:hypothetical protein